MTPAARQHTGNVSLDALALICAAYRGDLESGNLMLATYRTPAEQQELTLALLANAVCILRHISAASGADPEHMIGAVAATIRRES